MVYVAVQIIKCFRLKTAVIGYYSRDMCEKFYVVTLVRVFNLFQQVFNRQWNQYILKTTVRSSAVLQELFNISDIILEKMLS